ncbi:MAG: hydrogenase expression/formation protein HypE [Desulfurivibrionaceae bacterium]
MNKDTILLDHGSGGLASQELIRDLLLKYLDNPVIRNLEDSAVVGEIEGRIVFTTDSYVIDPPFFPGGNIGSLAVHGTINDLAMKGAVPICLSLGLILEEGLAVSDLEVIVSSIARSCSRAEVVVATGDTKVVPRGKGDGIFINTSGIGSVPFGLEISASRAKAGDKVILSGTMADHGISILTRREGLNLEGNLASDSMSLHFLVKELCDTLGGEIHTLRDPTRGGVATSLCEIAESSGTGISIEEKCLPVSPEVGYACEILGLDPLYLANEGKCLVIVEDKSVDEALKIMRSRPEGRDAAVIGSVTAGPSGTVEMVTRIGGRRLITPLAGEPLPRIC